MFGQVVALILISAAAACGTFFFHPRAPALYAIQEPVREDEVTLAQIKERWQGDVLWLDARPRDQFEGAHVPGADLLNEQEFDNLLFDLLGKLQTNTKPVVIYCSSERCDASRKVREKLLQVVPIEECYMLKGGWKSWQAAQPK